MRAEIVAVGTEILLGQIANTNARTISEALTGAGVDVLFHSVVGDNEQRIAGLIRQALERSDVVITTGGLGPTHDDLTREAIALATGRRLIRMPEVEEALRARFAFLGREIAKTNLKQADFPEGARVITNLRGSAPGIALDHEGKRIYAVPGVPHEMKAMIYESILPEISEGSGGTLVSRVLKVAGVPESDLAQRLQPLITRLDNEPGATIALLAGAGEVRVRITAKGAGRDDAVRMIEPVEEEARTILGAAVFGADDDTLPSVVARLLTEKGLTLAIAESVTGGMVASALVDVPGASDFLRSGYVVYSREAKIDLGVPPAVLDEHGGVSEQTTIALAEAARDRARVDLGLATTGEAGPTVKEGDLGQVFLALAWKGGSTTRAFRAPGERSLVRRWATLGALNLLRLWLMGEIN